MAEERGTPTPETKLPHLLRLGVERRRRTHPANAAWRYIYSGGPSTASPCGALVSKSGRLLYLQTVEASQPRHWAPTDGLSLPAYFVTQRRRQLSDSTGKLPFQRSGKNIRPESKQ